MTKRPDFVNKLLCLFVKEVSSFCPSAEVISSSFELQKNSILKCILTKKKPNYLPVNCNCHSHVCSRIHKYIGNRPKKGWEQMYPNCIGHRLGIRIRSIQNSIVVKNP